MSAGGGWTWRFAVSEGLRSLRAEAPFNAVLVGAGAVLVAVALLVDGLALSATVRAERDWYESGGTVQVVSASAGSVAGTRCDALAGLNGIESSFGARWSPGETTVSGNVVAVAEVTGGIYSFLGLSHVGVVLDPGAVDRIPSGPVLRFEQAGAGTSELPVAGEHDLAVLGPEFAGAVLVPSLADDPVELCFVRLSPEAMTLAGALVGLLQAGPQDEIRVRARVTDHEYSRDFVTELSSRTSRLLPTAAGLGFALGWLALRWQRRHVEALYQVLGAPRSRTALVALTQGVALAALAVAVGAMLGTWGLLALAGEAAWWSLAVVPPGVLTAFGAAFAGIALWVWYAPRSALAGLKRE